MTNTIEQTPRIVLDSTAFIDLKYSLAFEALMKVSNLGEFVSGIKYSDRHPDNVRLISEQFNGDRKRLPVYIDDSASGGYNDMTDEIQSVNKTYGFEGATFTLGRQVLEETVRNVSSRVNQGMPAGDKRRNKFLLSTYLPEQLPLKPSILIDHTPEEYTQLVFEQADCLSEHGVVGVYGAASIVVPNRKLALGAGVSFDGRPYISNGVRKQSIDVPTALHNSDNILIGRALLAGVDPNRSQEIITSMVLHNFGRLKNEVYGAVED